jgi:hypothetical protein
MRLELNGTSAAKGGYKNKMTGLAFFQIRGKRRTRWSFVWLAATGEAKRAEKQGESIKKPYRQTSKTAETASQTVFGQQLPVLTKRAQRRIFSGRKRYSHIEYRCSQVMRFMFSRPYKYREGERTPRKGRRTK